MTSNDLEVFMFNAPSNIVTKFGQGQRGLPPTGASVIRRAWKLCYFWSTSRCISEHSNSCDGRLFQNRMSSIHHVVTLWCPWVTSVMFCVTYCMYTLCKTLLCTRARDDRQIHDSCYKLTTACTSVSVHRPTLSTLC